MKIVPRQAAAASRPKDKSPASQYSESIYVPFFCAENDRKFYAYFVKSGPDDRYSLDAIYRIDDPLLPSDVSASGLFSAEKLSLAGWACPYCGHGRQSTLALFANCGHCHRLMCGKHIRSINTGAMIFSCSATCGHSSEIRGTIATYKAEPLQNALTGPAFRGSGPTSAQ